MFLFQDADAKLTLTRVASAPVLVAEVAKLTGRHLEVSPVFNTEILMVSVENVPSSEVLVRIATAATAIWQPIEGGYRLIADNGARGIEASSERARRLQAITENVRKKQAEEAKRRSAAGGDDEAAGAAIAASFVGGGGIDAFVPMLDLSAIANMEAGDRIVFATGANMAQRPLRGNPMIAFGKLIENHNKIAKTMSASASAIPAEMQGLMQGPIGDRFKRMSKPVLGNPAKIVIVASRAANPILGNVGLDVRIEARAYDARGGLMIEETGSLDTDMLAMFAGLGKKAATDPKSTPIAYSDDAKAFIESSNYANPVMGGGIGGLKLSPSLKEKLFAPDKYDPLALVPGEGLVALAKARRKPIVALIPDAAYPGLLMNPAPTTLEEVDESLKTGPMRIVPDSTYLVVKAAEPETARRSRIDRIALTNLLRAISDHETPTLDELSAYALRTVPPSRSPLSMSFLTKFAPATMGSMAGFVSWDALRLYGSLTSSQRQTLANGGQIQFSTVPQAGQNALRAMLYGAGGELNIERPGQSNEPDIFSMAMKMMMGGGGIDARDEPTEVAPQGLPANGYLQATVTQDSIIRPVTSQGDIYYSLGTDELAMFNMMASGPMGAALGDQMKLPEGGRLGTRTLWNLRGYVAPGAYVGSALTDDRTPKNGQSVSLSNLPADLQAKVAAKTEKLKKSPFGAIMAMGAMARPNPRP